MGLDVNSTGFIPAITGRDDADLHVFIGVAVDFSPHDLKINF